MLLPYVVTSYANHGSNVMICTSVLTAIIIMLATYCSMLIAGLMTQHLYVRSLLDAVPWLLAAGDDRMQQRYATAVCNSSMQHAVCKENRCTQQRAVCNNNMQQQYVVNSSRQYGENSMQ